MVTTRPPKTIVKSAALGPVANTDTKLLIYGLFQKGRVLAQDEVYLHAYDSVAAAREGIARYFAFFNDERPHAALGYQTPASFYDGLLREAA